MRFFFTSLFNFIFFLFVHQHCFAQGEGNNWYFGQNAGLNFNGGAPVSMTNGLLVTQEGCASISDSAGNLLFYTDGVTVWNRLHIVMPNGTGLMGNGSSTQSAMIVPQPNVHGKYFIFTVDCFENSLQNGLRYSVVDMSLQGGFGDVTVVKNILLTTPVCEKLTAVRHQNGQDIWIVTHKYGTAEFYSYLLTSAGVNPAAVISSSGNPISGNMIDAIGYLKANLQGTKLAAATDFLLYFEIFDFDNATGIVSNGITSPAIYQGAYGVEFSPDGTKLYLSSESSPNIHQFDLTLGSAAAIFASDQIIATSVTTTIGALQLGPDQKIYCCRYFTNWVSCITSPNSAGTACAYIDNAVNLATSMCRIGFPNFLQSFFNAPAFSYYYTCLGDSTYFLAAVNSQVDSVHWNFGDPSSGSANFSSNDTVKHMFTSAGFFTVNLYFYSGGNIDTATHIVHILAPPHVDLGNDTMICGAGNVTLIAGDNSNTYVWSTGATDSFIHVTQTGLYVVTANNFCVSYIDSIFVQFIQVPKVNLRDSILCAGNSVLLNATNAGSTYHWQDGSTNATYIATTSGIYYATATNICGVASDTAHLVFVSVPKIDFGNDTTICSGNTLTLTPNVANANYLWYDGSTSNQFDVSSSQTVSVNVSNMCGADDDTIAVTVDPCEDCMFIPNAFSPNGDGDNDFFHPLSYCNLVSFNLKIFNRWGQLVFETNDIANGWNGNFKSTPQEIDVYVYFAEYVLQLGANTKTKLVQGNLTLVR